MSKVFISMKARVEAFVEKERALEVLVDGLATSEVMGQRSVSLRARLQDTVDQAGATPMVRDWLIPRVSQVDAAAAQGSYQSPQAGVQEAVVAPSSFDASAAPTVAAQG